MWKRMMRVWLLGSAVALISLEGAPPEQAPPPDAPKEQPGGALQDIAGPRRVQDIIT